MGKRIVENLEMGMSWTSYIASVYGVLKGAGWWQDELYKLMGETGIAFHFIMHEQSCPSSVTVYPWTDEHLAMMDRIGVHSEAYCSHAGMNTFSLLQQAALEHIKESIDRGVGVVVWAPSPVLEFGIICGYDDEDGVLYVHACLPQEPEPLLYSNLGRSGVPMLFYQTFKGRVHVEPERVYRESLRYGVGEWNKPFHENEHYASGRKAYDNLIGTLERGDYNPFGLAYSLAVYAEAKSALAQYLRLVAAECAPLAGVGQAAALYQEIAARYARLTALAPFSMNPVVKPEDLPQMIALVRESKALEESAMQVISGVVGTNA